MRLALLFGLLLSVCAAGAGAVFLRSQPEPVQASAKFNLDAELKGAAAEARPDKVKRLLARGADPNAGVGRTRLSAIHFAMLSPTGTPRREEERLEVTRLLIQHGANPHAQLWQNGDTPLVWAAGSGYPKIVRYLLQFSPSRAEIARARTDAAKRNRPGAEHRAEYAEILRILGG